MLLNKYMETRRRIQTVIVLLLFLRVATAQVEYKKIFLNDSLMYDYRWTCLTNFDYPSSLSPDLSCTLNDGFYEFRDRYVNQKPNKHYNKKDLYSIRGFYKNTQRQGAFHYNSFNSLDKTVYKSTINFNKGKIDGLAFLTFQRSENFGFYNNGIRNGIFLEKKDGKINEISYYTNGEIKEKISFSIFNSNSFIIREVANIDTTVIEIYKNQIISTRLNYVNKTLHSAEYFWEDTGVPKKILSGVFTSEYGIESLEKYKIRLFYQPQEYLFLRKGKHIEYDEYYNEIENREIDN
jgi:hypothetical protein